MKSIFLIVSFFVFASGCLQAATQNFESRLDVSLEGKVFLVGGNFFLKVSGDLAEYQMWSSAIDDLGFEIESSDGTIFTEILGDSRVVVLEGCELNPSNPFLNLKETELQPSDLSSCDALAEYRVYEGVISDPAFIQSILAGNVYSVSVDIVFMKALYPATGSLNQVLEPLHKP